MQTQPKSARAADLVGLLLAAAGTALFSLKAIVVKLAYAYPVDAITLQTLRMLLALPLYLVIGAAVAGLGARTRLGPRQWLAIAALGLAGYYVASVLDLAGLRYISAGLERLILYLYPTLVLLMGRAVFGRDLRPREWIGMAISYLGIALAFGQDVLLYRADAVFGALLVFGSAAAYAVFVAGSGRLIPLVGSVRFTCYAMSAATVGVGAHYLIARPTALLALPTEVYWLGVILAVGCTVLPSFMIAAGIGRIGAERTALVGMIGPACTLLLGHMLLDEALTPLHLGGTALVLAGSLYGSRPKMPAAVPARRPT